MSSLNPPQMEILIEKHGSITKAKVLHFLEERNYTLISDISLVTNDTAKFTYICKCGKERTRNYGNIRNNIDELENLNYIPKCCLSKIDKTTQSYKWYLDDTIQEYNLNNVRWKKYGQYWISELGEIMGKKGNLFDTTNGIFKPARTSYTIIELLAKVFLEEEYESKKRIDTNLQLIFEDNICHVNNIRFICKDVFEDGDRIDINQYKDIEYRILSESKLHRIYKNGHIIREPHSKSKDFVRCKVTFYNSDNCVKFRDEYRKICKLVMLAFDPYDVNLCYKDYIKVDIQHLDGNRSNNCFENLKQTSKNEEIMAKINKVEFIKEKTRIEKIHEKVLNFIKDKNAMLLTPLDKIKLTTDKFDYKCICENIFSHIVKTISDEKTQCQTCHSLKLKEKHVENFSDFIVDGELFKRFELGWVSDKGKFLNNHKYQLKINKDGMIKIAEINYNAKRIAAITHKIKFFEKLSYEGFYVRTINDPFDFSVQNIFVWSKQKEGKKLLIDNLDLYKKSKLNEEPSYKIIVNEDKIKNKAFKEYAGAKIYENGVIQTKKYLTIGQKFGDYLTTRLNGSHMVHRLVCFLFNPIKDKTTLKDYEGLEVNHIDGNKWNNSYTNLEWKSKSENIKHAIDTGLCGYSIPVNLFKIENEKKVFLKYFSCIEYAHKETGFSKDYIKKLINNKTTPYSEYTFERAEKIKKINLLDIEELSEDEQKE